MFVLYVVSVCGLLLSIVCGCLMKCLSRLNFLFSISISGIGICFSVRCWCRLFLVWFLEMIVSLMFGCRCCVKFSVVRLIW